MTNLESIKKSISNKKVSGFSLKETSKRIIEKYKFSKQDREILVIALKYHKVKSTYLKLPKYSFPIKYKTDPKKQKLWKHFINMLDVFNEYKIDALDYFDYQFNFFRNNKGNLTAWFIYSESNINQYLKYKEKLRDAGITRKVLKTPEEKRKNKFRFSEDYIRNIMATRKCTEKQVWKDIILGDQIKLLSEEYLKQNKVYKELYKEEYYKGLGFLNPFN